MKQPSGGVEPETKRAAWPSAKARRRIGWSAGAFGAALVALILVFGLIDWNLLKGPVEQVLSARTGRAVHIDGNLKVHLLSWTPSATVERLRIGPPKWAAAGAADTADIPRLAVSVKLLPLFKGQVILPLVQIDKPAIALARLADGRNSWTFGTPSKKPLALPPILRFEINDGQVTLNDAQRKLAFSGTVNSSEVVDTQSIHAFKLVGDGMLNNAPFDLDLTGGPLLDVDPKKPYPFDLKVRGGETRLTATGSIAKPFDLGVYDASLTVSGDDLAHLYDLTGLTLPNSPPYQLSGQMSRRGALYAIDGLGGRVGDSDVHGDLSVQTGGPRPMLTADITSHTLNLPDIAAIFGGGADTKASARTSPEQAQNARALAASDRIFPDTPLHVERLRTMDARVKFVADAITSKTTPLRAGSLNLTLDDGLLTLDPLQLTLSNGQLAGRVAIDGRTDVPAVDLDLRLSGARIDEFVPAAFKGAASGDLMGRARLSSHGLSVRQAAAGASGQLSLIVPQGEMRANVAELLGVNVLQALFDNPEKKTTLRCAVADFKVTDGLMNAQTIVLDTGPVIATGRGTVSLKTERMDLHIQGHPKQARLIRLNIPLALTGPLRTPKLGVEAGSAAGQAGLAAFAGAVLSPIAAILPFIDVGLAKDANCQALLAQAGTGKPAPVAAAAAK